MAKPPPDAERPVINEYLASLPAEERAEAGRVYLSSSLGQADSFAETRTKPPPDAERSVINEFLASLPAEERAEAGRMYVRNSLGRVEDTDSHSQQFLSYTGQLRTGITAIDKAALQKADGFQQEVYDRQFLDYTGVLPTGNEAVDQTALDTEDKRQQQALEDYNRGFKSYTGAESTGDQEQDATLWEAESERRVGETQAWLDQGLELANHLGQESKNRADMIGNLNPGDQQRVGVGEVDAAQDSRFQDWLAAEPDLGFDNSAYRAELSEYLASLQRGEQQHLEDHRKHLELLGDARRLSKELAAESERRKAAYAAPEGPVQHEGPLIGQTDLSGDPRLNAIVERMEAAGYYSAEDIEAVRQSGEPLREGEREFVGQMGDHYDLMRDLRGVTGELAAESERRKAAFIAPEGAVQQGGPLIGQADLSGDPRLAGIVERMKAAGYYSAEDIEAVRQSGEPLREGERRYVTRMGGHYDLLQDLRGVTGELAAESDRRKAAYAASPEGPVQHEGPLIGQADLSGDPRLADIVERMEGAGYSAEDIEAVRQSGEALREGEREFVTDLSVAADIAAETEAAKKAQERDMLLGGGHYGDTGAAAEQLAQWRQGGNVGDLAVGLDYDNQLRLAKPDELNDVSRLPETIYIDGIPHNLQEVLERNRFEDVGILQQLRKPVPYTELEIRSEPWLADPSKSRLVQQGDRTTSRQEENLAKYEEKLAQQNVTLKETLDGLLDSGRVSFNAPPDGPEIVELSPPWLHYPEEYEDTPDFADTFRQRDADKIEAFAKEVADLQAQGKVVVVKAPPSFGDVLSSAASILPGYNLAGSLLSAAG